MSHMQCFERHLRFKNWIISWDDEALSGRPVSNITLRNIAKINQLVHEIIGGQLMILLVLVCHLNSTCGISLPSLSLSPPLFLTTKQKEYCFEICQDLCQCAADDPSFMSRIISGGKNLGLWVRTWDDTAVNTMEEPFISTTKIATTEPQLKQERAHCFVNIHIILHWELISQGLTVYQEFYCNILRCLREDVRRKQLDLCIV